MGVLNSSLIGFYHQRRAAKGNRSLFPKVVAKDLKGYPIPATSIERQEPIRFAVGEITERVADLQRLASRFEGLVAERFEVALWPNKLSEWWKLGVSAVVKGLKLDLSLRELDELTEFFESYQERCAGIQAEVNVLSEEIDHHVFDLYGLSEDEIRIVRGTA